MSLRNRFCLFAAATIASGIVSTPACAGWEQYLIVNRVQLQPNGKIVIYTRWETQCAGYRLEADATTTPEFTSMVYQLMLKVVSGEGRNSFHAYVTSCEFGVGRFTHLETVDLFSPP